MSGVAHLIGNGKSAGFYSPSAGLKITTNLPPFEVNNIYTTVMVDFKMMNAIHKGVVVVPGDWVLGARPHKWMEMRNDFYMKYSRQIKEFYLVLPRYAANYTDFNCGHMAAHYVANKLKRTEIHMYGFDSIFEFDTTSMSDLYLESPRDNMNKERMTSNWRQIWDGIYKEFPNTQFVLYHDKGNPQLKLPENVEVKTSNKGKTAIRKKIEPSKPFDRQEILNSSV